jgi:drug/metabolite transporter (DMT)-like permease
VLRDLNQRVRMTGPRLALLSAAATGVQVGAAITATRFVAHDISPVSLAFLRYAIGVACLVPFLVFTPIRLARRDITPIALLGIGQFGILIALLNEGLQSVSAGRGALIFASFPLLTLAFAALAGHERISLAKLGGIALTLVGVALVVGDASASKNTLAGELFILAAAAAGAICSVLYRPYLRRYPTLPVSAFAMAAAAVALFVPALLTDLTSATAHLNGRAWAAILFIGVSSGSFYVLWLWALKTIVATRVTIFLALSPITAALLGHTFLGEPLTFALLLSIAFVAAGLWVANRAD